MELQHRIVEHLLVPNDGQGILWPQYARLEDSSVFSSAVQLTGAKEKFVEFLEYTWLGCGGTGARGLVFDTDWMLRTGSADHSVVVIDESVAEISTAVRSVSTQLSNVKAAFGLSISQLAKVLAVKRPTIYSWMDPETGPETLRGANRARLNALCDIAHKWNELSKLPPSRHLTASLTKGGSLFALLSADKLDRRAIEEAMKAVAKVTRRPAETADARTLGERLRKRGFADVPRKTNR